jgi:magnesium-transporting ATPase (P-type)
MPYVRSPKDSTTGAYIQAAPARVCEFSSDTQCMSVICRVFMEHEQSGEFSQPECIIYSKGSPEKMRRLCRPETIPDNFAVILDEYASQAGVQSNNFAQYIILAVSCLK